MGRKPGCIRDAHGCDTHAQGRIQDLIRGGGAPDRDRPKTAILGPQFCRILVLGPHFWWSRGGARAPGAPPWIRPCMHIPQQTTKNTTTFSGDNTMSMILNTYIGKVRHTMSILKTLSSLSLYGKREGYYSG